MIDVDRTLCDQCGTCVGVCSSAAIYIEIKELHIDDERCVLCSDCIHVCPVGALKESM